MGNSYAIEYQRACTEKTTRDVGEHQEVSVQQSAEVPKSLQLLLPLDFPAPGSLVCTERRRLAVRTSAGRFSCIGKTIDQGGSKQLLRSRHSRTPSTQGRSYRQGRQGPCPWVQGPLTRIKGPSSFANQTNSSQEWSSLLRWHVAKYLQ